MMFKKILYGTTLATLLNTAYAIEIKGEISPGYDSNPYRVADDLDDDEAWFIDTNIFANQKFGKLKLSGELENRAYEGSFNNADVLTGELKGTYKNKHLILDKKITSKLGIETGFRDKTYVNRTTGNIGTSGGKEIEDRYDYDYWKLFGSSSFQINKKLSTALALTYKNKSYDDQNIASLSVLDYDQADIVNKWIFRNKKGSQYLFSLGVGERDFDNKRQKTKAGTSVPSTDLKYFYHNVGLSHLCDITPALSIDVGAEYEERTDNGLGYYDTEKIIYSADAFYTLNDNIKLFVKTSYQDYEYTHSSKIDEEDDEEAGKQGYTIKMGAEKDLNALTGLPALGFVGIRFDDFDSNDPLYEYDRYQAFMGIKVSFEQ